MWNVPNILTIARLSVLPAIVLLLWPGIETRVTCFWAAAIYSIGMALDMVDGAVARHTGQVTVLGKFLDPLADKLFYLVTLVALMQLPGPRIPPIVVMLILARELSITGLRGIAVSEGVVISASEGGKLKTVFASAGAAFLVLHYPYTVDFGFSTLQLDFHRVGLWLTLLSLVLALWSGFNYVLEFVRAIGHGRAER